MISEEVSWLSHRGSINGPVRSACGFLSNQKIFVLQRFSSKVFKTKSITEDKQFAVFVFAPSLAPCSVSVGVEHILKV